MSEYPKIIQELQEKYDDEQSLRPENLKVLSVKMTSKKF